MEKDSIDELIEDWGRERPDLDFNAMHVVGRILVLALIMGRSASDVLGKQDLSLWAFDVLATLRRKGEPFRLSPSEISREVMLSPAAMVNRLDRLEQVGYVRRIPNPRDRRGVIVELTAEGRAKVDAVIHTRLEEARSFTSILDERDRRDLAELLRKLLLSRERKA